MLARWEKVVEHEFSLKLRDDSCKVAPSDDEMVSLLQMLPSNWTLGHDEVLVQFLSQHIEKDNINLGSIRDYVESVDVSSLSVSILSHRILFL